MVSVFNFKDYRAFMRAQFASMPKGGYGQARRLARALDVHTTLVSQVMQGLRPFTPEQASQACEFFALNEMETDFFLLLVQLDRAGSPSLRRNLTRQIESLQAKSKELANRLIAKGKLSEESRAIFYSSWAYSAVRQMTAISGYQSIDAIADYFGLPRTRVRDLVDFLLSVNLCKEEKGQLRIGPTSTHLESKSPWARVYHLNWRQKAVESLDAESPSKLNYTAPMTLSRRDAEQIRELISKFLETVDQVVEPSPSEELHCLNIDWFPVVK
jgi:uncharacterized protein (TIGR02147 family)